MRYVLFWGSNAKNDKNKRAYDLEGFECILNTWGLIS